MAKITVFHQERFDGGRRTGMWVDKLRAFEHYVMGDESRDSALLWYIDMEYLEPTPPKTQKESAVWLNGHKNSIESAVKEAASHLSCGIDGDGLPWVGEKKTPEGNLKMYVTAANKFTPDNISHKLNVFISRDWKSFLEENAKTKSEA